jgi:phosphodiesterase/alkaline phosphatase D-like protein
VTAINITGVSATITWTTDDPAESQVEYGESASYGSTAPPDTTFVQSHSVNLTGLSSQTTYHYKVKSRDASGLWAESGDFTFTTADTNAPTISGVVATDISATTTSIIWTSNEAATSLVEYGTTASYGSTTSHDTSLVASHRVRLTGLKSRTTYHYRVKSRDAAGFWAESGDAVFATTDINAPVISKVAATSITGTDATITWTTDDAAESQVEYGTSAGYGLTTTLDANRVTKHSVYLTGLTPQVTYHYKVKSRDASGLWADSADYTFTTGTDPGGIPPAIILVRAFDFTGSGATIAWETNREATSQVEYGLTTDYGKKTTLDVSLERYHSVDLRALKANKTYHYRVISTDAFGNQAQSEDQTFDTTIGEAPSLSLPTWAWAIIGATVALVVGAMVVREL